MTSDPPQLVQCLLEWLGSADSEVIRSTILGTATFANDYAESVNLVPCNRLLR